MKRLGRIVRSLFSWVVIVGSTIAFGIPAIIFAFLPPRGDWYLPFARGWARVILRATGVSLSVEGAERVGPETPCIYFANHESLYDIFVLLSALPGRIRFLAKKSLFYLPVLGWSMAAAGFVAIDRTDRRKAAAAMERAAERLRGGLSLIVFPEQTRTRTGELLPFKKGGVVLALRTGLPIVPVGIAGTFPIAQKGAFSLRPGPAAVAIGSPIPVAGRTVADRSAILDESRQAVADLRARAAQQLFRRGL
jgi:1-acyl-sn-glycerol-3-phosphate acyltransferase